MPSKSGIVPKHVCVREERHVLWLDLIQAMYRYIQFLMSGCICQFFSQLSCSNASCWGWRQNQTGNMCTDVGIYLLQVLCLRQLFHTFRNPHYRIISFSVWLWQYWFEVISKSFFHCDEIKVPLQHFGLTKLSENVKSTTATSQWTAIPLRKSTHNKLFNHALIWTKRFCPVIFSIKKGGCIVGKNRALMKREKSPVGWISKASGCA